MNLILQHWDRGYDGLPSWGRLATASIERYSKAVGADYKLVSGFPLEQFSFDAKPVGQKLCAMLEEYDHYDDVLVLDTDMVATNIKENVFDYEGIGRLHRKGMASLEGSSNGTRWPKMYIQGAEMYFGNCIKLNRAERTSIREVFPTKELLIECSSDTGRPPNDEIILSYCLRKSKILEGKKKIELPHAKFCDLPEEAATDASLVHFCGARKTQIANYLPRL